MDMRSIASNVFGPVKDLIFKVFTVSSSIGLFCVFFFFLAFFMIYNINPFKLDSEHLENLPIKKFKLYDFLRWKLYDFSLHNANDYDFNQFGFTFFVGRQGSGKTISMVKYLNDIHDKFPDCFIVTNFSYTYSDYIMTDWRDLLEIRNGDCGVVFAIDEIHSEYSSASWKDFPENLLSEISQQRKQRVKIVATSQVFSRVAKPLREQAFSVILCETFFKRFTFNREYDAAEFSTANDNMYQVRKKVKTLSKTSFVQSNFLRDCYDTYEKIERMKKIEFIPRAER